VTVQWCDPPPQKWGRGVLWRPLLDEVTQRPGEWALLKTYPSEAQAAEAKRHLKRGRVAKPGGRWEFRKDRIEGQPGAYGLWARWLGE
jgi:hypothetical protein